MVVLAARSITTSAPSSSRPSPPLAHSMWFLQAGLIVNPCLINFDINSVTSVGGTEGGTNEIGTSLSAGGFSNIFSTPQYQSSAVAGYLAHQGSQYNGKYNSKGRGFPDISAFARNYLIYQNGALGGADGTSAATPLWASVIALINDRRIAKGKRPLGFLNPWLYSSTVKAALKDITSGEFLLAL